MNSQGVAVAGEPKDTRPYVVRTYDRWIILVLVVVLGWFLFRPLFGFAVYYRGVGFERMFQLQSAEHYYIKSTWVYPKMPQAWQGWGELVMMRAPSDESQRQIALQVLQRGISYNPNYGPLEFDLGRTYFMGKQYKQATQAFLRGAYLMPNDLFSWDYAAWSSLRAGDAHNAIKYWYEVLRIDPGNAVAHRQIARLGT